MLCSLKGKWKTHHYIHISLFFFWNKETYICTSPNISPGGRCGGTSLQRCQAYLSAPGFQNVLRPGCALHPPPPTHTHTPPATRSPQVCIEKAQRSLARSCPEESGSYVQRAPSKTVLPPTPFLQTPFIIVFSCLVFLFVLMRPVGHIPGQLSLSLGVGVAGFFPLTFSLLGLRWMLPVCVCVYPPPSPLSR